MKKQIILMDQARIERAARRLAIQIRERLKSEEQPVLIGLNDRGFAMAQLVNTFLDYEPKLPVTQYVVSGDTPLQDLPDCDDKAIFLIDDVIFSGRTMFSALSAICGAFNPSFIEIITLIDRGHRKYPLHSELTGMRIPTKAGEHIEVMLEKGTIQQAVLFKNS